MKHRQNRYIPLEQESTWPLWAAYFVVVGLLCGGIQIVHSMNKVTHVYFDSCHRCHQPPVIKNLKEYKDVHNKKKQDSHTKWLRAQIDKEMIR